MSYGDLMDDLSSAWRKTNAPQKPKTDDGCWVHTLQIVFEELEALGLSEPVHKPEPKKRGRKKKNLKCQKPNAQEGVQERMLISLSDFYSPDRLGMFYLICRKVPIPDPGYLKHLSAFH